MHTGWAVSIDLVPATLVMIESVLAVIYRAHSSSCGMYESIHIYE
jgi:hypothetical protein